MTTLAPGATTAEKPVANHTGAVVFPAAGMAVILASVLVNAASLDWWGAEEAAASTAVFAWLGGRFEAWRHTP